MCKFSGMKFVIKTFLLYIITIQNASSTVIGKRDEYQSLTVSQGLYNSSDYIVILNSTNLKSSVYASKNGWFVEFYNSWCGFCRRFAPTWKALARNILLWRDIVVVAAIDCADDDNNPICREYEIMHYPMLKYFPIDEKPGFLGIEVDKGKDMDAVRHNLIKQLEREQQEGRGSTWPNIASYRSADLKNLWKAVPDSVKYYFLIFEAVDSFLGAEVILDLHNVTGLQVRSVTSDNEPLCIMHNITKFPTLIVLDRNELQRSLNIRTVTREGFRQTIIEFMSSKGISIDIKDIPDKHPEEKLKTRISGMSDITKQFKTKKTEDNIKSFGDVLFQLDLESVLQYSINHEVPMVKLIQGEKLQALKMHLNLLAKYFPLLRSGVVFLEVIRDIVKERESLSGEEFRRIVRSTEEEMSPVYSGPQEWVGCKGSTETFRGYPCGLWIMYHMLSVNSAMQNKNDLQYDPTEVLRGMHGYIKNFFGCSDCSQHFVEMAARNKIFEVRNANESILWLWRSHNEVNKRLAGDETEDPENKKIQYPSKEHCPPCRYENSSWNEAEVLLYLKKKYSHSGINYYGSSGKPVENNRNNSKIRQERLALTSINQRRLGWDFTIFDISICVVLYVASATILVLVCIKFAVKRTYRKKTYVQDFLGRV